LKEPLTLNLPGSSILSSEVTLTRPEGLDMSPDLTAPDELTLARRLLNPGDLVELQLLVDGHPDDIVARSRVTGVRGVDQVKLPVTSWDETWKFSWFDHLVFIVLLLAGLGGGVALYLSGSLSGKVAGVVAVAISTVSSVRAWKSSRRNRLFLAA
jgi:hypothetical protein